MALLSSSSKNYSWFFQYMYNENVDVRNKQPSLGNHSVFVFLFILNSQKLQSLKGERPFVGLSM